MLGAGVLKPLGLSPSGNETIAVLSRMYTETLGAWASALFLVGALFVLFSSMVSGLAGNARLFADAVAILGWIPTDDAPARRRMIGVFTLGAPALMATTFFLVDNPVWMITLGGIMGALMMPLVAGATLYLRHTRVDRRIAPGVVADVLLWACTMLMVALGVYAVGRIFWV
jgi:Mn2+/Fe2+ NRAMP family transporter